MKKLMVFIFLVIASACGSLPGPRVNARLDTVIARDKKILSQIDLNTGEIFPVNGTRADDSVFVLVEQISELQNLLNQCKVKLTAKDKNPTKVKEYKPEEKKP